MLVLLTIQEENFKMLTILWLEFGGTRKAGIDNSDQWWIQGTPDFLNGLKTKVAFLVYTGAVFSRTRARSKVEKCKHELYAANGSIISTYGTITLELNLRLRQNFKWRFLVADVARSIIRMDFLSHYGLLVGSRRKLVIDKTTHLTAKGSNVGSEIVEVNSI